LYQRVRRPAVAVPPTAPRRTVLGGSWRDGTKPGDYLDTDVRDADCCSSRGRACSRARLCILDPPYSAGSKTLRATKAGRPTESNQHLFERALNIASERIVDPGELARMLGAWQVPLPARSVHGLAPPGISGDLVLQSRILDTIHARRAPRMVAALFRARCLARTPRSAFGSRRDVRCLGLPSMRLRRALRTTRDHHPRHASIGSLLHRGHRPPPTTTAQSFFATGFALHRWQSMEPA